ncbi:hypothetical protein [Campylobacter troglodytis]|uniref:hypothetical protein n=1 Tax=Campylobacter troglodytis TaxID=654363 RepID=UPI00115A67EB|nr:hypothetical protein [Campylobacter troglodytis]
MRFFLLFAVAISVARSKKNRLAILRLVKWCLKRTSCVVNCHDFATQNLAMTARREFSMNFRKKFTDLSKPK